MPDWKTEIRARLAGLALEPTFEAEIIDELSEHADDRYRGLISAGVSEVEATRRVLAELYDAKLSAGLSNEEYKSVKAHLGRGPAPLFSRWLPFSARIFARFWKLALVAVLSLAVAIAASVVGLSFFNALLLRPPAAADPGRLVTLYEHSPRQDTQPVSLPEYKFYRDTNQVFSGLAGFNYGITLFSVSYNGHGERATGCTVTDNYFDVLDMRPLLGRYFTGDDSAYKGEVVLSYSFWQRLGADPQIAGKSVQMSGRAVTVVGVTPREFTGTVAGFSSDLWVPVQAAWVINSAPPEALTTRDARFLTPIGRLKPGVKLQQAQANMSTLAERMAREFPDTNKELSITAVPTTMLPLDQRSLARMLSWTVCGIVLLVLLAACANVINLLLGLATARRQEMLVRAALGATRGRLVRQLLKESAFLTITSGLIGFALAYAGLARLFATRFTIIDGLPPLLLDFRPDAQVTVFTVAVIVLVTTLIGIVPALYSSIPNLAGALNGEIAVGGTRKRRARSVLVVVQTMVCTLVLVGAGLCLRSLESLKRVPLGFTARNIVSAQVFLTTSATPLQQRAFHDKVRQHFAALPGVTDVSAATSLPLNQNDEDQPDRVTIEGKEDVKDSWSDMAHSTVEDNYFSVLGLPLLTGRTFNSNDTEHSPEVALVNQTLARKFWPKQDPLGKRLRIEGDKRLVEVIGVTADSKYDDLDEPQTSFMYLSLRQHPQQIADASLIVSTNGDPRLWMNPVRNEVHTLDSTAVCLITTMDQQINLSLLLPRIIFASVGGFGLMALVLAMSGLYATTFYSVSERKKEIGIRIALGAQPRSLVALLVRQSTLVAVIGLVLGIGLGIGMSALLKSLLFGIQPVETSVLVIVSLITVSITLLTAYLAARPWVKIDPLEAIRHA